MLNFCERANDDTRRRTPTEFGELKNDKIQHMLVIEKKPAKPEIKTKNAAPLNLRAACDGAIRQKISSKVTNEQRK
jgi:hypothetical protein